MHSVLERSSGASPAIYKNAQPPSSLPAVQVEESDEQGCKSSSKWSKISSSVNASDRHLKMTSDELASELSAAQMDEKDKTLDHTNESQKGKTKSPINVVGKKDLLESDNEIFGTGQTAEDTQDFIKNKLKNNNN